MPLLLNALVVKGFVASHGSGHGHLDSAEDLTKCICQIGAFLSLLLRAVPLKQYVDLLLLAVPSLCSLRGSSPLRYP